MSQHIGGHVINHVRKAYPVFLPTIFKKGYTPLKRYKMRKYILHDRSWIWPWTKWIYNELDIVFRVHARVTIAVSQYSFVT